MKKIRSKKLMALLMAVIMCMSLVLTACGSSQSAPAAAGNAAASSSAAAPSGANNPNGEVPEDATGVYAESGIRGVDPYAKSSNPDKIVIKVSNQDRDFDSHPKNWGIKRFLTEIKAQLGDKVEFQVYFNGSLGTSAEDVLGALQNGSLEMATWSLGSFSGYTDAFMALDLLYFINSFEEGYNALSGEVGQIMRDRCLEQTGLMPLMFGTIGMRQITNSKKPITSPADLNGLKIRTQSNNFHIAGFEALGASPTGIAYAELFTALQQGVVDAQENPIANIYDQNFEEVQKYLTMSNHLFTADCVVVSKAFYDSLPEEFQTAIQNAIPVGMDVAYRGVCEQESIQLEELGQDMEITYLTDDEAQAMKEVAMTSWDKLIATLDKDYFEKVQSALEAMRTA